MWFAKTRTETAFQNEFWENERAGIYVDIITGEPLFSSVDKSRRRDRPTELHQTDLK